ncbi:helix-turn-helix transcriptional regulator [Bacillus sp. JJ1566]|uniref:helix-turn-helix transcriptional regulator n=1 Tax=Bacillus sp. JJ1566 TaxID=3122961 RepID=UPI00300009C8
MKVGRAAKAVKEARHDAGFTQQQLSFEIFESREAVSQQENGRYKVQPNITNYFASEHNNPWVAMEASAEYMNWGPAKLDGEAADLHRTSVLLKTQEELEEALKAVDLAAKKLSVNPKQVQEFEIQIIEKSILECIDVITASNHYVAVLCKEYGLSWTKMWTKHKLKLIQRRFLKK